MARKVERNRNGGKWTEAGYWGSVRSALRRAYRYWKPAIDAKMAARRKYEGENKRQKWEYLCAKCSDWFADKEVQVDHIEPVGTLKCGSDLESFLERLTPEEGFQVLCKECHQEKTNLERGR